VTATAAGTFNSKDAGSRTATATYTLANGNNGGAASNYTLAETTGLAATISPKALTVAGTSAAGKTYDGNTNAAITVGTLSGLVGTETVTATAAGTFNSKDAGSRTATATYTLANGNNGGAASNYTLADTTGLAATISPASISAITGITANDKVYDGSTAATLNTGGAAFTGKVGNDALTVASATGAFNSKAAGTDKTVNITVLSLGGASAGNYILGGTTASTTADITPRTLTVTAGNATRQEGLPNPSFTFTFEGLLGGDTAPLELSSLLSTPAGLADPAGTYPIRVRQAAAGDYVIRGIDGVLTISPAARIDANTLLSTSLTAGSQFTGLTSTSTAAASTTTTGTASSAEPNRPAPTAALLPTAPAGSGLARPQAGSQTTTEALRFTVSLAAPQQQPGANAGLSVTLPDGAAVPQWVSVNTTAGTVTVDPTQANTSALDLRVTVKDPAGVDQVRRWLIPLLPEGR
jgi:hypothetical protein